MKNNLFISCFCLFISFYLNSQNTLPTSGNVGVGTTNPLEKLQIGNTFTFHDGGHGVIGFRYAASGGTDLSSSLYAAEIRFDPSYGNLRFGTSTSVTNLPTTRLAITKNGYIGIGTTSPSAKLEVVGSSNHASIILANENLIGFKRVDGALVYGIGHTNGEFTVGRTANLGSAAGTPINIASGGTHIRFSQSTNERMRIDSNGNVGIGTTAPDAKLAVKGNIHTNEVKVDLLGAVAPDYVFYKDYDLKTLTEVENYIDKQGHLPNIPSAKEMKTNGVYLKEMNLKLLEKIEELTLYVIGQEKRIKLLETENNTLKTQEERIKLLETQFNLLLKNKE